MYDFFFLFDLVLPSYGCFNIDKNFISTLNFFLMHLWHVNLVLKVSSVLDSLNLDFQDFSRNNGFFFYNIMVVHECLKCELIIYNICQDYLNISENK